jgi:hypothetical protein
MANLYGPRIGSWGLNFVNHIYGGFSNVRVAKKAWNGTAYV